MRLDPVSLKLYVSVVERGSIAAAAEDGHIAAAAVSKRISELEAILRTPLLKRTNKGVQPTPAGMALLNPARRLLSDLDDIVAEMRDWSGGVRGQVRVFANISAITQFLPREIAAFLKRHPQIQLHLQERISSAIVKALIENETDVGIGVPESSLAALETFPYHDDELVLIAPRGHPLARRRSLAFADALDFDFVGLHTGSSINLQLVKASLAAGRGLRVRIQVTSYDALARMVEAGLGIGVMPRSAAQALLGSLGVAIVKLTDSWSKRQLVIWVRDYDALPVAARMLVDSLRAPG